MKKVYLILYLVPIFLGSTFSILKLAVAEMSPYTLIMYRFLFASLVMLGLVIYGKTKLFDKKEMFYGGFLGLILAAVYFASTVGVKYTSASNAGFLSDSTLVFVVIFSYIFLKQKLSKLSLLGLITVFVGMYALIFTDGIRFYRGDFIVILAPIFGAIHVLVTSKITKNISINTILLYQFITVTIVAFVVALFTQSSLTIESVNLFLALSYLGFFVTTFRYFAEIFSMRKIDPTNVTLVMLLTPLWSALFAYVFLD